MKYKVGDKVKIREDLQGNTRYLREGISSALGTLYCNSTMCGYRGVFAKIVEVNDDWTYRLDCDNGYYAWSIGMLEPVTEEVTTTTNEITINLNKLNEEDRKTIQKIVNKQNNPFDIPTHEHNYYYINAVGGIDAELWMGDSIDKAKYILGNYFLTIKEAKFEVEKRKIIRKLEILAKKSGGVDWNNDDTDKYYIEHDVFSGDIRVDCVWRYRTQGVAYFPTRESCQQAINLIGESNIKKYIFGVEE